MTATMTRPWVYERPWMYPKQTEAFFCPERYSVIEGSTKSGKTVSCMCWLAEQAMACTVPGRNYWWVAPIYPQARIAFRRLKRGLPPEVYTANETELTLTLANGAVMWFKGGDKTDSLYGEDVYAAVIDEASRCFAKGTLVQTPHGPVPIEFLRVGDDVLNAAGVGRVRRTLCKHASSLAVVKVQGYTMVSSIDHRYFTQRGWVEAHHLESTDRLIAHPEAVCLLRDAVHRSSPDTSATVLFPSLSVRGQSGGDGNTPVCVVPDRLHGTRGEAADATFLRTELFREMENEPGGLSCQGHGAGDASESQTVPCGVLAGGYATNKGSTGTDCASQSDGFPRVESQDDRIDTGEWAQASRAGRQWGGADRPANDAFGGSWSTVRAGTLGQNGSATDERRLANTLLHRHSGPNAYGCDRDRWTVAQDHGSQGIGPEEGRLPDVAWVDSVTLLERGDKGFSLYSGGADTVDLYDLDVSGHPSFVVNDFLVHNCKEEVWTAVRSTLTATRGPLRIIGNVKGRRNWAYRLARMAEAGTPDMRYSKITARDAVAAGVLDAEEIEDAQRTLPDAVFRELYLCEPSDDGGNPFGLSAIRACVRPLSSLAPAAWGIDLAKSHDWTVCLALDAQGHTCRFERWQSPWRETIARIEDLVGHTPALVDSTGVGDPILEALQRPYAQATGTRPGATALAAGRPNYEGFKFTAPSKQQLMEGLAAAIGQGAVGYPEGVIVDELDTFEYAYTRTGVRYSAPEGLHDDTVCALALAKARLGEPKVAALPFTAGRIISGAGARR